MASASDRRKELEAELEALKAAEAADEPEFEYEIGRGNNYARVSSKSKAGQRIAKFFMDSFDINLEDEPVQDEADEGEGKEKAKPGSQKAGGASVRAFNRRIS